MLIVRFWLDHSDVGTEGSWKLFSTGKAPTFSNWAPGQPDDHGKAQDCGYAYYTKNGAWDDSGCAYKISSICESSGIYCCIHWSVKKYQYMIEKFQAF